jgi:hypothetical protein
MGTRRIPQNLEMKSRNVSTMKTILLTIILAVAAHTITARTDTTYYDAFGNITTAEHLQGGKAIVPKLYHVTDGIYGFRA